MSNAIESINGYEYDPSKDLYIDSAGNEYIENSFANKTTFINISNNIWKIIDSGYKAEINWDDYDNLPEPILHGCKSYGIHKLKTNSPGYLNKIKRLVNQLDSLWNESHSDFSDLDHGDHVSNWQELGKTDRSYYRELYRWLASKGMCGAQKYMASELKEWKGRENLVILKEVTDWNPTTGAYTLDEWEKVKEIIQTPYNNLSNTEITPDALMLRAYYWLSTLCGKRPIQMLGIRKNGIKKVSNEWIVKIRPAKKQAGRDFVDVIVTDDELIYLLEKYASIPEVNELQAKHDRFFVSNRYDMDTYKELPTFFIISETKKWWPKHRFECKRNEKPITLSTYRIRHTVATNMAMNNFPRDIIAELMEHDSNESANAYINACASRLSKELNKVDLNNNHIFSAINEHYFNGVVVADHEDNNSVYIPSYNPKPLLVGSCGRNTVKEGVCNKHPFLSCYTCSSFRAWKDGNHCKAIEYFDSEIKELSKVSESDIINRDLLKLREAREAALEVIKEIDNNE